MSKQNGMKEFLGDTEQRKNLVNQLNGCVAPRKKLQYLSTHQLQVARDRLRIIRMDVLRRANAQEEGQVYLPYLNPHTRDFEANEITWSKFIGLMECFMEKV